MTETGEPSAVRVKEEGDVARIARLVREARQKNPIQFMATSNSELCVVVPVLMQHPITNSAATQANPKSMGMPSLNVSLPIKISTKEDGSKQLKRSRVDDGEAASGMEEVEAVQTTISSLAIGSPEIVMRDNCLFESDNVRAGPGHQACPEK